jgi:hypothetical protein
VFPKKPQEPDIVNEKYSYLIVQKNHTTPNVEHESEQQAKLPFEKSYFWPRLVRPVIRKHKHTIIDLCSRQSAQTG